MSDGDEIQNALEEVSGQKTVPNIFISKCGIEFVMKKGNLNAVLSQMANTSEVNVFCLPCQKAGGLTICAHICRQFGLAGSPQPKDTPKTHRQGLVSIGDHIDTHVSLCVRSQQLKQCCMNSLSGRWCSLSSSFHMLW